MTPKTGWVAVDCGFSSHPKVLDIGPLGEALWLRGLCYAGAQLTDGFIPASFIKRMGDMKAPAIADRLVAARLWDEVEGGYQIHGYLEWQRSRDAVVELSSKRAEAGSRGGKQKASNLLANSKQNGSKSLAEEKRREESTGDSPPLPPEGDSAPKYSDEFEAWFEQYPKGRGSKKAASDLWRKLSASDRSAAMAAMPAFNAGRDWQEGYHKAPEVWLKGRFWENPPPPANIRPLAPIPGMSPFTLEEERAYRASIPYLNNAVGDDR